MALVPTFVLGLTLSSATLSAALAAAPDGLVLSRTTIAENLPPDTLIGTFTTLDPDVGDTHTYILVENPLDLFAIVNNQLFATQTFDFEAGSQRQIRVRTTDSTGAWLERNFTINTLDRNDPPLGATLSATGTPETTAIFGLVGTISQFGDQDQNDAWTYRLVDDAMGHFILEGNQLRVAMPLDYETDPLLVIIVEVTDRAGLKAESAIAINVWDRNEAPLSVLLAPSNVAETAPLGTVVGTLSAFGDPDFIDTHVFNVVGGDNAFVVDGTTLRVAAKLDFETAPVRTVRIRVTDRGGLFAETNLTVFVEDRNEAPTGVRLSSTGLPENSAPGVVAGQLEGIDQDANDTHLFELADTADSTRFVIENDSLIALVPFDYETKKTVNVPIRVTDAAGLSSVVTLVINILDVNEAPTDITLTSASVYETAPNNAIVGFISVVDADANDTHELYLLQDGNGAFRIDNRILRKSGPLDFETAPSVDITMIAFDRGGVFFVKTFTIEILDVDEPATGIAVDPASVSENLPIGSLVGDLIPVGDPDEAEGYRWVLVENPGNRFAIVGGQLVTNQVFNYELLRSVQIRIRALPPVGAALEQNVTIEIRDEPEPPTGITISGNVVQENRNAGTFVATLSAVGDPDAAEQHTFSLVTNPDDAFTIQGNTLSTGKLLDFETTPLYELTIRVTDRSGLFVEVPFEIRIIDVNEAPTGVALSNRTIAENSPANSVVGQLSPIGDPDLVDRHVYQLSSNPDDRFDIVGDTLIARLPFNFETPPTSYRIVVRVSDQGTLTAETAIFINVTDVNESPSPITLANRTLLENAPAGTVIDTIGGGVDPDNEDLAIFEILEGEGFAVDAQRRLVTTRSFDHETEPTIALVVRLSDSGDNQVLGTWTITVADVPEAPDSVGLSSSAIAESAAIGDAIGTLSAIGDPDVGDTHTFTIGSDPDNLFIIDGDTLRLNALVDYEKNKQHEVTLVATDSTGLTATTVHLIEVLDANDRPTTLAAMTLQSIPEDDKELLGFLVSDLMAGLSVDDVDSDDVWLEVVALTADGDDATGSWQWLDESWIMLAPTDRLPTDGRIRFVPDADSNGQVTLIVVATDGELESQPASIILDVRPVNDPPSHAIGTGRITTYEQARTLVATALGAPLAVTDVDADVLGVTLTAPRGVVTLPTTGLVVRSGAPGTTTVTVEGPVADLNAALALLELTTAVRFTGETTLVVRTDDLGATGEGGPKVTTDTITVQVGSAPDLAVVVDATDVASGADLDLERVGVSAFHHVNFVIENRGSVELVLDERLADQPADTRGSHGLTIVDTTNSDAWISVKPALRIAPGQASTGVVTLRPRAAGPVSIALAIGSNDPEPATWTATLNANAVTSPDIVVSDGVRTIHNGLPHAVADLVPGQTRKVELTLANTGAARLELGDTVIVSSESIAAADIIIEEPFPLLDVGETDTLSIYLTPGKAGRIALVLAVPTNDPDAPTQVIHLIADVVTTPAARLALERVPGVFIPAGSEDVIGFGRVGRDLGIPLRLVNLGGRALASPKLGFKDPSNLVPRLAADVPDSLDPGDVVDFSLFVRPEAPAEFSVSLTLGDEVWTFRGTAIGASDATPATALALYRHGVGKVESVDALGPVTVGEVATHAWLLVNEGPDPLILQSPFALSALVNVDALPLRQPVANLPPQRATAVPVSVASRSSGRLAFDLEAAEHPLVKVQSDGQVGLIGLELDSGQRIAPNSVVQLPLQRVGEGLTLNVYAVNDGNGPLAVDIATLEGGAPCVSVSEPDRPLLGRGERAVLKVRIEPVAGAFACTLTVNSDDASRPVFEVAFVARGTTAGKRDEGCGQGPVSPGTGLTAALTLLGLLLLRGLRGRASRVSR
jgi:hypothetical protein